MPAAPAKDPDDATADGRQYRVEAVRIDIAGREAAFSGMHQARCDRQHTGDGSDTPQQRRDVRSAGETRARRDPVRDDGEENDADRNVQHEHVHAAEKIDEIQSELPR